MKTRRLFYEDCHLQHFSARVTECIPGEKGYYVNLDATAFYPEGGGQACDTGTLGGARVLDVREKDGDIVHLCDSPLTVGETVEGNIDFDRRFDLMQQHTGEHIVSGILHAKYGFHNTGFHVGADVMQVDFDGEFSPQDIPWLEEQANKAVWENQPVRCWIPSEEELKNTVYRTKRELPWPVRIVQVGEVDSCACCGIHVGTTAEVGLIKIFSCVKFHQGVRMEMACGKRALALLSAAYDQNRQVSQAFSAKIWETGEAARKMNRVLAEEKYRCAALERQLFDYIAESYVNQENVLHFTDSLSAGAMRDLAERISKKCRGFAGVFVPEGETVRYCLCSQDMDLRSLGREMTTRLSGRGGGKPNSQQGTLQAKESEIRTFFAEAFLSCEI